MNRHQWIATSLGAIVTLLLLMFPLTRHMEVMHNQTQSKVFLDPKTQQPVEAQVFNFETNDSFRAIWLPLDAGGSGHSAGELGLGVHWPVMVALLSVSIGTTILVTATLRQPKSER
jgi:hypothetical protein